MKHELCQHRRVERNSFTRKANVGCRALVVNLKVEKFGKRKRTRKKTFSVALDWVVWLRKVETVWSSLVSNGLVIEYGSRINTKWQAFLYWWKAIDLLLYWGQLLQLKLPATLLYQDIWIQNRIGCKWKTRNISMLSNLGTVQGMINAFCMFLVLKCKSRST